MVKKALITGVTGQDGSYLADLLLEKGYDVHGLVRRSSVLARSRIDHLYSHERVHLHYGDLTDGGSLTHVVDAVQPDEVYHLGAMSHVSVSYEMPEYTDAANAGGTHRLLQAVQDADPGAKFYHASSSEIFGTAQAPHDESSPLRPRNPYGHSKLEAQLAVTKAREVSGLFAVCGIAFNHESPRRGENFVTRKITQGVAAIELGIQDSLTLGNLDAVRDWGYAPEYAEAMWRSLQADEPTDYVLATGQGHTVRDFVVAAFAHAGLAWEEYVRFDEGFTRPSEVDISVGNPAKAQEQLGWVAQTRLEGLVGLMLDADRVAMRRLVDS